MNPLAAFFHSRGSTDSSSAPWPTHDNQRYVKLKANASPPASAPLAPDGSFAAVDDAADGAAFYRAVFVEPVTGLPVASLLRSAVAPG
jgi:hypothetical protein